MKISLHVFECGGYTHWEVRWGRNPLGPRGGECGNSVELAGSRHFWRQGPALKFARAKISDQGMEPVGRLVKLLKEQGESNV